MSNFLYAASVPVYLRYLERMQGWLEAAESHAQRHRLAHAELLGARLADGMYPFGTQVAIAANFALRACFPLAGLPIPPEGDFEDSFLGLRARIAHVQALLNTLLPRQFEHSDSRVLNSQAGRALVSLPAPEFLFQYALPNFFFHATSAYAILRSQGLLLGKQQFDGFHRYGPEP